MRIALIALALAVALGSIGLLVSARTTSQVHTFKVAGDILPGENR